MCYGFPPRRPRRTCVFSRPGSNSSGAPIIAGSRGNEMLVSVVICSHTPRPAYLERVMAALRLQSLPTSAWELLLIDNASPDPLAARVDLSWHPQGRHVREEKLGLTPARLR